MISNKFFAAMSIAVISFTLALGTIFTGLVLSIGRDVQGDTLGDYYLNPNGGTSATNTTKDGYTFAGWWTLNGFSVDPYGKLGDVDLVNNETGLNMPDGLDDNWGHLWVFGMDPEDPNYDPLIGDPVTQNMTLYARWIVNNYTLNTAKSGTGYTISSPKSLANANISNIDHWVDVSGTPTLNSFKFTLTLGRAYDQSNPIVNIQHGTITNVSQNGSTFTYTATVNGNIAPSDISVTNIQLSGYIATFDAGLGTTPDNQAVAYGDLLTPAQSTRTGYNLAGWFTADGTDNVWGDEWDFAVNQVTQNITLYAKWTLATYTITHTNMVTGYSASALARTYTIETATFNIGNPVGSNAEVHFGRWIDTATNQPVTQIAVGTTGNITLRADWDSNVYTVSFNLMEGTDTTSAAIDQRIAHNNKASKPATDPTKTGHTFAGWYTLQNTEFDFTNTNITSDLTLFARWNVNSYNVNLTLNGGNIGGQNLTQVSFPYNTTINLPTPVKTGHTFLGWYGIHENVTYPFADYLTALGLTKMPDYALSVFADWQIAQFTVTFRNDYGSTIYGTITRNYNTTLTSSDASIPANPTRTGYKFNGWKIGNTPFNSANPITIPANNIEVIAIWVLNLDALDAKITEASNAVPTSLEKYYRPSTLTYLRAIIGQAGITRNSATEPSQVNGAIEALNGAISSLRLWDGVLAIYLGNPAPIERYRIESYNSYWEVYESARNYANAANFSIAGLQYHEERIVEAIAGLVEKWDFVTPEEADSFWHQIEKAKEAEGGYVVDDKGNVWYEGDFTPNSWLDLIDAINRLNEILAQQNAEKAQLEAALLDVQQAYSALEFSHPNNANMVPLYISLGLAAFIILSATLVLVILRRRLKTQQSA